MRNFTSCALSLALTLCASTALAANATPMKDDKHHGESGGMGEHHKMMEQHFMKADTDKDGSISKAEWQARGEAMFKEIDTNADGKLSHDEMRAHHETMKKEWKERREERMERREEIKGKIEELKEKRTTSAAEKH